MQAVTNNIKTSISTYVNNDRYAISRTVATIAKCLKTSRENVVYVAMALTALYMTFGYFAELICNLIGFVYPALLSIEAVESLDRSPDQMWLSYWVLFGLASLMDFGSEAIMRWFPFYWLCKSALFLWLYMPWTNGIRVVHWKFIKPFYKLHAAQLHLIK